MLAFAPIKKVSVHRMTFCPQDQEKCLFDWKVNRFLIYDIYPSGNISKVPSLFLFLSLYLDLPEVHTHTNTHSCTRTHFLILTCSCRSVTSRLSFSFSLSYFVSYTHTLTRTNTHAHTLMNCTVLSVWVSQKQPLSSFFAPGDRAEKSYTYANGRSKYGTKLVLISRGNPDRIKRSKFTPFCRHVAL